jgi:NAD(P)-dependent dehydrogenase (short-subunit alcohol dehydrogenase family)
MSGAIYPSLKDRGVFVTGGATGIGAGIVEAFAQQGSKVAFVDIDVRAGQELAERLGNEGVPKPLFLQCDLRDIPALRAAIQKASAQLGVIRTLVNNAANDERHALDTVTPEYWDDRMAVNLRHQFFATQAVYPAMAKAGGGSIVNLGSITWLLGEGGMPGYSAAKAAIAGLTRSLARDLGVHNIRVNSVLPGWIMTERQIKLWLTPESEKRLLERQCLKRKLYPVDIARVVLFFAADDSGACTNQNYIADAGQV